MTGTEYANLVASYLSKRFGSRTLKFYREIRVGKTIIGKNRRIDIFCVAEDSQKAFAIECKFQDSQGDRRHERTRSHARRPFRMVGCAGRKEEARVGGRQDWPAFGGPAEAGPYVRKTTEAGPYVRKTRRT